MWDNIFVVVVALHSSSVGQLAEKSPFRRKKNINSRQSKSLSDIVNLLLRGEKAILENGSSHNLSEIPFLI